MIIGLVVVAIILVILGLLTPISSVMTLLAALILVGVAWMLVREKREKS